MSLTARDESVESLTPRPLSRAYHPTYEAATRRDAVEFLRAKGCELRPAYAALAIVYYLQRVLGRDEVCGADIRALFPRPSDRLAGPLRNAHDILRRAVEGDVTTDVPASFLQQAEDVIVVADEAAWTGR